MFVNESFSGRVTRYGLIPASRAAPWLGAERWTETSPLHSQWRFVYLESPTGHRDGYLRLRCGMNPDGASAFRIGADESVGPGATIVDDAPASPGALHRVLERTFAENARVVPLLMNGPRPHRALFVPYNPSTDPDGAVPWMITAGVLARHQTLEWP